MYWRQRGHSKIEDDNKKDDFQSVVGSFVCSPVTNLPLRMRAEGKKDKNIGGEKMTLVFALNEMVTSWQWQWQRQCKWQWQCGDDDDNGNVATASGGLVSASRAD